MPYKNRKLTLHIEIGLRNIMQLFFIYQKYISQISSNITPRWKSSHQKHFASYIWYAKYWFLRTILLLNYMFSYQLSCPILTDDLSIFEWDLRVTLINFWYKIFGIEYVTMICNLWRVIFHIIHRLLYKFTIAQFMFLHYYDAQILNKKYAMKQDWYEHLKNC